jgi:hypothetical protein
LTFFGVGDNLEVQLKVYKAQLKVYKECFMAGKKGPNHPHTMKMAYAAMKAAYIPRPQIYKALTAQFGYSPKRHTMREWDKLIKDLQKTPDEELADDKLEIKNFVTETKRATRDMISDQIEQVREEDKKRDLSGLEDKDYQNIKLKVLKLASDVVFQEERLRTGANLDTPTWIIMATQKSDQPFHKGIEDGSRNGPEIIDAEFEQVADLPATGIRTPEGHTD